ncbi:hypothetical protein ACFYT4_05955 [Streptomyces sp. NPDC004609]|uniref:hypothetical protein n=1 Tax=Streptomyces sp. NPDC004609 TaxID=3364704 RepID=UPI0036880F9D
MSERPSADEIAAFLADVRAPRTTRAELGELAARKAELLERIAAAMPGDEEAEDVARLARAAADKKR